MPMPRDTPDKRLVHGRYPIAGAAGPIVLGGGADAPPPDQRRRRCEGADDHAFLN